MGSLPASAPDGLVARQSGGAWTQYAFDGYGNESNAGGTPTDPFGYNAQDGYYLDRETGLYCCQARYYDPGAGRWLTRDPIGYAGGVNLYGYCAGGPVGWSDPSGLDPDDDDGSDDPFFNQGIPDVTDHDANDNSTPDTEPEPVGGEPAPMPEEAPLPRIPGDPPAGPDPWDPLHDSPTSTSLAECPDGSFSISNWDGYPEGLPKPPGPFRNLFDEEYESARKQAYRTNRRLRREWGVPNDEEIHEIHPVKQGGSPTDIDNKAVLNKPFHRKRVTPWWNGVKNNTSP